MYGFPINPESVLVSHDTEDVFVSFHFVPPPGFTTDHLALFLEGFLKAEAVRSGYIAIDDEIEIKHGP